MALVPRGVTETSSVTSGMPMVSLYAPVSSNPMDVPTPIASSTSAPVVAAPLTERIDAVSHRRLRAKTPFVPEAWHAVLSSLDLLRLFPSLPSFLLFGFAAGVPALSKTFAPPNSSSLLQQSKVFHDIVQLEYECGRYIGPFTRREVEQLIGPFQTSPLSLVPKTDPTKFRLVQNFSFPYSPLSDGIRSINSYINSDDFPCTWGTFNVTSLLIARLPPGSQGAIRDVSEAYRRIPLAPDQWPAMVVRLSADDDFAINTSTSFGAASAGGQWGYFADALTTVLRASGIGPLTKWVDDFDFLRMLIIHLQAYLTRHRNWRDFIVQNGGRRQHKSRIWYCGGVLDDGRFDEFDNDCSFPVLDLSSSSPRSEEDAKFTYCLADVDRITGPLGVPWAAEKEIPFCSVPEYIGFFWDLDKRVVGLPEKKKKKYLAAIDSWLSVPTHTLSEAQQLYGKLMHSSNIVPAGRAYLTALEAFMPLFRDSPHMPRHPPKSLRQDLAWWSERLSRPVVARPVPGPVTVVDIGASSDASSGVGLGITIGNSWRAWRLLPGWQSHGRTIAWAEAVAFELLTRTVLRDASSHTHYRIYGDNTGVVDGWKHRRSHNQQVNLVFRRILDICEHAECDVHAAYVTSECNPSDAPSRGLFPNGPLLPAVPLPDQLLPFIRLVTDEEVRASRPFPGALPKPPRSPSSSLPNSALQEFDDNLNAHSLIFDYDVPVPATAPS